MSTASPARRLTRLPPYLFAEIDRKKKAAISRGRDIISLGVGDPDLPTPPRIVRAMQMALRNPAHHQYPLGPGLLGFREAIARWMLKRFGVHLSPDREIHALIGSKEGIGHLPLAWVNPGETVLIPEPGYPVYHGGTLFAGGRSHFIPLLPENDFLPDLSRIPRHALRSSRLLFLNYPNNPTGATATLDFFREVIHLAHKFGFLVAQDAAYSEMYFGEKPPSILSILGAKDVAIEFHSLSKTFCMTGWRVGWVCGNSKVVSALSNVKDNLDSGVFGAIQESAAFALLSCQKESERLRGIYQRRRDFFIKGLESLGWDVFLPKATFYIWAGIPEGISSLEFSGRLLAQAGVVCTPGAGFGPSGEGYVRFALTQPEARLREALSRIAKVRWRNF